MNGITFTPSKSALEVILTGQQDFAVKFIQEIAMISFVLYTPIKVHLVCRCNGKRLMRVKFSQ